MLVSDLGRALGERLHSAHAEDGTMSIRGALAGHAGDTVRGFARCSRWRGGRSLSLMTIISGDRRSPIDSNSNHAEEKNV